MFALLEELGNEMGQETVVVRGESSWKGLGSGEMGLLELGI